MKARETVYKGITFRSRLEAAWAAMFDEMGWVWVYEPYEYDGYIPDFEIKSCGKSYLVEIKPLATWVAGEREFLAKMANTVSTYGVIVLFDRFRTCGIGVDPTIGTIYDPEPPVGQFEGSGSDEMRLWFDGARYDFLGSYGTWELRFSGDYDGNCLADSGQVTDQHLALMWSRALNKTRWMPANG